MDRKESKIKFVGLHGHSSVGSPFDGLGIPDEHMSFAWENGMDALALTDHGNMNGMSYQYLYSKKMNKDGRTFKPIYGVEAYVIDSVENWLGLKEQIRAEKGTKVKDVDEEEASISVEDEEETKNTTRKRNPLNKRSHLVLLAQNQIGLKNLYKLVSHSFRGDNYYRYPRMDYKMLKEHSEGIIASTACLGGPLFKHVAENPELEINQILDLMIEESELLKSIFNGRYYLELQWNGILEQHIYNQLLIETARQTNTKLISTADSHYPRPELWKDRELYKKLGWISKKQIDPTLPSSVEELQYELYPKNGDQMWEAYKKYSAQCEVEYDDDIIMESIERTHDIAFKEIEAFEPDTSIKLPSFIVPEGMNDFDVLLDKCINGLQQKGLHQKSEYVERLRHELDVIKDRGFTKYFLTMEAIASRANKTRLTGPGRGSAAGSLLSYVLGITQVDPIRWNLQFERFLTKGADSYPDIDFDCSNPMELKEELVKEWGENSVVPITNYNNFKLKSLIKDVAKFYSIPFDEVNAVTSKMDKEALPKAKAKHEITAGVYEPTYEEYLEFSPSLSSFLEKHPIVFEHIKNLVGQQRSQSRHAGGVLVAERLDEQMPLIASKGVIQTPWSEGQRVRHLEPMGFIKFDLLGLETLAMMTECIGQILLERGEENTIENVIKFYNDVLNPDKLDFDDQKVYENIFHKGKFLGIFQFAERGMQQFCVRAKPRSLIDITALTSIYRPGPLSANVDKDYVKAKEDPSNIRYIHPMIKDETESTYGFVIFQEQIASITAKIGKDIDLNDGNIIRKLLTKKGTGKGAEELQKYKSKFLEGAREKKIDLATAEKIWGILENFAGYGFNKSHALAYSIVSFQCAYLATYYPMEWAVGFLEKECNRGGKDAEEKKQQAIAKVIQEGIIVEQPNINKSGLRWMINDDRTGLIAPLTLIKGLGDKAVNKIIENRPFATIEEALFGDRKIDKRSLDVLIRTNVLHSLLDERFESMYHLWRVAVENKPNSLKKFTAGIDEYRPGREFTQREFIDNYFSLTGIYPLERVLNNDLIGRLEDFCVPPISEYDEELGACWFIPIDVMYKKTARGKDYYIMRVIDINFGINEIKCWGVNPETDSVELHKVYLAKVRHDEWGFSISGFKNNLEKIT